MGRCRWTSAPLPLAAVETLADLAGIQSIRTADGAVTHRRVGTPPVAFAGMVTDVATDKVNTSEGDVAHQADVARQTHGVDGAGIGISVVSDGIDSLVRRSETGDLPAWSQVTVVPSQEGWGDEGTALLEIVHDLAPGADLYFATGRGGQARMAENIEALCEAGADVIVDDIGYLLEAAFQDDLVSQGVAAATADGCYHFSAAGNNGNLNDGTSGVWEGDFVQRSALDIAGVPAGAIVHDVGGGVVETRTWVVWSDTTGGW